VQVRKGELMPKTLKLAIAIIVFAALSLTGQALAADAPTAAAHVARAHAGAPSVPAPRVATAHPAARTSPRALSACCLFRNGAYGCLAAFRGGNFNGDPVILLPCDQAYTPDDWYYNGNTGQFINQADGLCLDADVNHLGNGDKVQLWQCNGQAQQSWCFAGVLGPGACSPFGNRTIVNFDDYLCLDARAQNLGPYDTVQLWSCNGRSNQNW
jgi:hypothetical protein